VLETERHFRFIPVLKLRKCRKLVALRKLPAFTDRVGDHRLVKELYVADAQVAAVDRGVVDDEPNDHIRRRRRFHDCFLA